MQRLYSKPTPFDETDYEFLSRFIAEFERAVQLKDQSPCENIIRDLQVLSKIADSPEADYEKGLALLRKKADYHRQSFWGRMVNWPHLRVDDELVKCLYEAGALVFWIAPAEQKISIRSPYDDDEFDNRLRQSLLSSGYDNINLVIDHLYHERDDSECSVTLH